MTAPDNASSRRDFLLAAATTAAAATAAGCSIPHRTRAGIEVPPPRPGDKLRIAVIGCGGKGLSDMQACAKAHRIVALCDVDEGKARNARTEQPEAAFFHDYRDLFDAFPRDRLDAVVVATPDHSHAVPALMAMQRGMHVFVQKPLTHTVHEARVLAAAARKHPQVVTSMGNQGTCLPGFREAAEVVRSGALGAVREVHVWTDRPIWPQGIDRPGHVDAIPATFRWDLWLGPAPHRPYAAGRKDEEFKGYAPFHWRGWWDFGTGAFGDMACHVANLPFFALELGAPEHIEAESSGCNDETAPKWSIVRMRFPARGDRPAVLLTWYDGGKRPPAELLPEVPELRSGGFLLVGDAGRLYSPTDYGERYELYPKEKFAGYQPPTPWLPRSPGIHEEWLQCILDGSQPMASFAYAAPFTEAMLLGNVALRAGRAIRYDGAAGQVVGDPEANALLTRHYRRGFELPAV